MGQTENQTTPDLTRITDPEVYATEGHPWASFDYLRREAPVYWYEQTGLEPFWAITRYDDVLTVSTNPAVFSSSQRLRIEDIDSLEILVNGREKRAEESGCPFEKPLHMLNMDPPTHRENRGVLSRTFTPRSVAQYESTFRQLSRVYAADFEAALVDAGDAPVNFVKAFADKLPLFAICTLAGVPERDWQQILYWTGARADPLDPEYRVEGLSYEENLRATEGQFFGYLENLIAQRRTDPQSDMVSLLTTAQIDGDGYTDRELLDVLMFLISAGNETTRSATTYGVEALLQHPVQLQRLIDDPSLIPAAVEEILRWASLVIHFTRTCTTETELRGRRIRAGETVVMFYPSANRDEAIFPEPYTFDVARDPNPHVAFGRGEHHCLGVNLARLELRLLFEALLPHLPNLELAGRVERVHRMDVMMAKALPIRRRGAGPDQPRVALAN